jgi:hypothetical protein
MTVPWLRLAAGRPNGAPFPRAMTERCIKISEDEFARRVEQETV